MVKTLIEKTAVAAWTHVPVMVGVKHSCITAKINNVKDLALIFLTVFS